MSIVILCPECGIKEVEETMKIHPHTIADEHLSISEQFLAYNEMNIKPISNDLFNGIKKYIQHGNSN